MGFLLHVGTSIDLNIARTLNPFNLRLMRPPRSKRYIEDTHIISLQEYHYFDKNVMRWYVLVG